MRHRGKEVQCKRVLDKARGTWHWRVTGSLPGQGQKQARFSDQDEKAAWELRAQWEDQRLRGAAATQPKLTHLTHAQLRQAEAAFALLDGENASLIEAVKHLLTNRPSVAPTVTFAQGLKEFLMEKRAHLSDAHYDNYRIRGASFETFVGEKIPIASVTSAHVDKWLKARKVKGEEISKKYFNNLRNDLSAIFVWFVAKPRQWVKENPVDVIPKFSKKSLKPQARQRLEVSICEDLMRYIEQEKPLWGTFFALTLFLGLRPDMKNGETWELAKCVARDGPERYFANGFLHLSAEITKEGAPRQTAIPANVAAWLKKFPPTKHTICPGDYDAYGLIRERFSIGHDVLRHTAISAFIAKHHSLAEAALQFGNSEAIIRRHYLRQMSKVDADKFYDISPETA